MSKLSRASYEASAQIEDAKRDKEQKETERLQAALIAMFDKPKKEEGK
jgi:hypothetical protein